VLDAAGTHYTKNGFPHDVVIAPEKDIPPLTERPGRPYNSDSEGWKADTNEYRVIHIRDGENDRLQAGRYLIDAAGHPVYRTDLPIARKEKRMDNGVEAPKEFTAPQPELFANIIKGILGGSLQWSLILIGVMIAVALEFCGVSALPVAVGMYLSLGSTIPIFIGGLMRLIADKLRGKPKSEAEAEMSPGVLLASGYIAGGTLCGLIVAFLSFDVVEPIRDFLNIGSRFFGKLNEKGKPEWKPDEVEWAKITSVIVFGVLAAILVYIGSRKEKVATTPPIT
jgi:hypothetical protein